MALTKMRKQSMKKVYMNDDNKASRQLNRIETDSLIRGSQATRLEPLSHLRRSNIIADEAWFKQAQREGRLL